jgi:hypothetical protein
MKEMLESTFVDQIVIGGILTFVAFRFNLFASKMKEKHNETEIMKSDIIEIKNEISVIKTIQGNDNERFSQVEKKLDKIYDLLIQSSN